MDIVYFIRAVLRKKWIIISCTLIAIIATFLFTLKEKKSYSSLAEIATGFTMNDQIRLNDQGFDIYTIDLKFDNVIKTFTSPQVLSLLSYSLILHDLDTPQQAFRQLSNQTLNSDLYKSIDINKAKEIFSQKLVGMQMLSTYDSEEKKLTELLKMYSYDIESLKKNLNVYRLDQTDYIDISFVSENPLLSAYVVNMLCEEFNRFYSAYISQRTASNVQYLDTLLKQKKAILDSQQRRLNAVMSGGDAAVTNANVDLINEDQTKLFNKKSDLNTAQLSLAQVNKQLTEYDQLQKAIFQNNSDIIQLNNQISDLQTQYESGGSKDNSLKEKIDNLKKQLQNKLSENSQNSLTDLPSKADLLTKQSALQVQIQSDLADINNLQSSINALTSNVKSNSSRDLIISSLQKDVEQARNDYLSTQEKYGIAANDYSDNGGFKQVLVGQPAVSPLPSHRLVTMAMAGAAAFFICVMVIVFLEYIDLSVKTPSFFSKQTGLKVLSAVNKVNLKKHSVLDFLSKAATKGEKRQNTIRELIRKVRHSIEKTGHRIILFTSTEPRQGKTTLIQALAYSFSLSKKKVLIIDTNFCNNDLTIQVNAKPTMEGFSSNKPHLDDEDVEKLITHTSTQGVDAIGCEGGDYTPKEILPEGNVLNYLQDLAERYDYIFLEAAPMNEFSDTKEMIEYVDGVIAIFSSEAVIKQIDIEGINYLKSLNGKFNGAILNKVDFENLER